MKGARHTAPGGHRRGNSSGGTHPPIPAHTKVADTRLIEDRDTCLRCERVIELTVNGWVHR